MLDKENTGYRFFIKNWPDIEQTNLLDNNG